MFNLINRFFNKKKQKDYSSFVRSPQNKRTPTINGWNVTDIDRWQREFDNAPAEASLWDYKLPWSVEKIDENITVGEFIVLWWKYEVNRPRVPLYLTRNYVDDVNSTCEKLRQLGYLSGSDYNEKTELGVITLKNNYDIVTQHRNNWENEEERKKNQQRYINSQRKHISNLKKSGLHDLASELEKNLKEQEKDRQFANLLTDAEKLSKSKEYKKSNDILLELKDSKAPFKAPIYERLAINYRGLKEYEKEQEMIQEFLNKHLKKYGENGDSWKEKFEERLEKSKKYTNK